MGVTAGVTRGITRAVTNAITGMGAGPGVFSPAAAISGSDIQVTFTTSVNLLTSDAGSPGVVGFYWSIGEGVAATNWQDVAADEANNHSFTVPLATIGAAAGDVINIDPGYSLTSPAGTKVVASDSGRYIPPTVYNVVYDDTTPTEGVAVTLDWDYIIGPPSQVVTYRHTASTDGVVGSSISYTPTSGVVGETLTGRVTSTLGSLSGFDDTAATSAVASAASPVAFDETTTNTANSSATNTVAHTPAGTPSKVLVTVVHSNATVRTITGVSYGGQAMTLEKSVIESAFWGLSVYSLAGPPAGAQNAVVTLDSAAVNSIATVTTFTGGSTTTAVRSGAPTPTNGTSTAASITVTSAVDDLVFAALMIDDSAHTMSPAGTETERSDEAFNTSLRVGTYTDAGAASVSMDATVSFGWWRMIGLSMQK